MDTAARARTGLWARFREWNPAAFSADGYTDSAEENLLPGIDWLSAKADLSRGGGHELKRKIRAVHSSAALAVNCFGPFRTRPQDLLFCGKSGAQCVQFEKQLPTSLRGTPPNLDVWIERRDEVVAVESKLLEYLTPTRPHFADAYAKLVPKAEACWQTAYALVQHGRPQYLDCAQLIKHHFGLRAYGGEHPNERLSLLYIFWEPLNWEEAPECRRHREEVAAFADAVAPSRISFQWMTYSSLWEEWSAVPALAEHAQRLTARYEIHI